jgi:redox-sensing transcriptional repressor
LVTKRAISVRVIRRVSFYYEALLKLNLEPDAYISSKKIEEMTGVSCNQIRQDFFYLGIAIGRQKKGYQVGRLIDELKRVLSIDQCAEVIVVGAGRLGRALAEYPLFWVRNVRIVALFDKDPGVVDQTLILHGQEIPILHVDRMESFLKNRPCVNIALLTVPEQEAQGVLDNLVGLSIKGVVNFAPRILKLPKGEKRVQLINECIGASLYKVVYQIFQRQDGA